MVPEISKIVAKNDLEELNKKVNSFLKITIALAIPSTAVIMIFSKQILNLLFPNASEGFALLQINSFSILFSMIAQTINGILQGIGKNHIPLIGFSLGMILKFLANIILIRNENIGIKGAALGNIICNATVCLIGFCYLKKYVKINFRKY